MALLEVTKECPLCLKGTIKFYEHEEKFALQCTKCPFSGGGFSTEEEAMEQYTLLKKIAKERDKGNVKEEHANKLF